MSCSDAIANGGTVLNISLPIPRESRQMGYPLNHVSVHLDYTSRKYSLFCISKNEWFVNVWYFLSTHKVCLMSPLPAIWVSTAPSVELQMGTRCRLSHNFFRKTLNQNTNPLFHIKLMEFLWSNSNLTSLEDCGLCTAEIKSCWYLLPVPKLEGANQRHLEETRGTKK